MKLFENIKGDFSGALSAAVIMLPMSIGYGIIAYSSLGMDFAPTAALLGIYSAGLCCFVAALLGGTPIQISGPKAPLTLALAAVVGKLVFEAAASGKIPQDPAAVIGLASLTVMIAGISQVVFGILGLGSIVKYVPQPVVAGFMNGIAFLLIFKQLKPLMGVNTNVSFADILKNPGSVDGPILMAGALTIVAILFAKRYARAIPASIVGLSIGTATYYLLQSFGQIASAARVIGPIQTGWPQPVLLTRFSAQFADMDFETLLPPLIVSGLIIGLIGSMESLLSSVVSDNLTGKRHKSNRELAGQGAGNIVSAIFGALPGAGSIPRTAANFKAGGRGRLSGMLCGLLILLVANLFGPLIGKIPLTVIAGIVIVVGFTLFDRWSLNLVRKIFSTRGHRRPALVNLILTLVVTVITISVNLIAAVVIGIIIASALFISKVGKFIVRRQYAGDLFHSRKMRNKAQTEALEKMGGQISVIELQGPLFFGSAEHLAEKIEHLMSNSPSYFILDMKRVNEIDSTGANIILRIKKQVEADGKYFIVSNLTENSTLWEFLEAMNVMPHLNTRYIFQDTDAALEWAEDHLLQSVTEHQETAGEVPLSQMDLLHSLTEAEFELFQQNLVLKSYSKGEIIIPEDDSNRDLYLLKKGSVTVKIHLPGKNCDKRLYTYSPGIVFGEIAFLDGGNRSAGVWAQENCEVLQLPFENFERLHSLNPELTGALTRNIALELSRRLRRVSEQMRLLEDAKGNGCQIQP